MPLRDHFHPPLARRHWEVLHGQWPAMIVIDLNKKLPAEYVASPRVRLGAMFEIDVAASRDEDVSLIGADQGATEGGVAVAVWSPPKPTLAVMTDLPDQDEYEVLVHEADSQRLVAAIEIVSPGNKDRPDNRRAFVAKCASLLHQGVSVSIVDVVTDRRSNLYADLLEYLGQGDRSLPAEASPIYAAAQRWRKQGRDGRLESWGHSLVVGQPLPTLPLWLAVDYAVPLELESTYEETCRTLRIK